MKFEYTQAELDEVVKTYFNSTNPLVLKSFPPKEKKKYLCLIKIMEIFHPTKKYREKEINELLKSVYEFDYCIIRRYLIVYEFLDRLNDGSLYWVKEKTNESLH